MDPLSWALNLTEHGKKGAVLASVSEYIQRTGRTTTTNTNTTENVQDMRLLQQY